MVKWSALTKRTLTFTSNNTRQDKTMAHKAPIDEGKGAYSQVSNKREEDAY